MKFKKDFLRDLVYGDADEGKVIVDEHIDNSRWDENHYVVFEFGGKYYDTSYAVGLTESQDYGAFEFGPDEIECREVEPYEEMVVVKKWRLVK